MDVREQPHAAHDRFNDMGGEGFRRARARRGLLATGENVRKRTDETRHKLTAQEARIAQLVEEGLSNPKIGGRELFISPRTFAKLGISSRKQTPRGAAHRLRAGGPRVAHQAPARKSRRSRGRT